MRLCYVNFEQVFFIQLHKARSAPSWRNAHTVHAQHTPGKKPISMSDSNADAREIDWAEMMLKTFLWTYWAFNNNTEYQACYFDIHNFIAIINNLFFLTYTIVIAQSNLSSFVVLIKTSCCAKDHVFRWNSFIYLFLSNILWWGWYNVMKQFKIFNWTNNMICFY